jgi:flagellar hook-length control protein FliK
LVFGIAFAKEIGAGTLLQLEWKFKMPANTLAIFAAKAPVEPTVPNQDRISDEGSEFKSFLDNATHKTDKAHNPSKENSSENQNDTQTKKIKSTKTKSNAEKYPEEDPSYREIASSNNEKIQSASEPIIKDSHTDGDEIMATQMQEFEINQSRFEALLDLLGLNGEVEMNVFLQSLSQALNLSPNDTGQKINSTDLLSKVLQNKGETVNFLKQVGLSNSEAKNLLNSLQSLKNISAQQALDNNVNDEGPAFFSQLKKTTNETDKSDPLVKVAEKMDPLVKVAEKTNPFVTVAEKTDPIINKIKKIKGSASIDKLQDIPNNNQAPRINIQEPVTEKPGTAFNLNELLSDKNAQANILQTENFSDKNVFNKGLETGKISLDLQTQPPTTATNTVVKAVESIKPILPEHVLTRGATEAKIINQIADKMTIRSSGSENEVHIKLDPPSLGTVRMNIITSGDSVRTVIVAENQAVKQVIENNFNQLRDAMDEQGLKVDSLTVTVGGESNQQNSSGNFSGKEDDPSLFEQMASNDTDQNPDSGTVSLFFGDNQSISVIV